MRVLFSWFLLLSKQKKGLAQQCETKVQLNWWFKISATKPTVRARKTHEFEVTRDLPLQWETGPRQASQIKLRHHNSQVRTQ
ncbi:hypothetical protein C27AD_00025 [Salinisphaera hydrothermalis C27AD]